MHFRITLLVACAVRLLGQTVCQPVPAYSPCEIQFELSAQEMAAHPKPYDTVSLEAEFRSPRFRTYRLPAFWDGGNKLVIRFTPMESGGWTVRFSGNLTRFDGKETQFSATPANSHGFLHPANVHHWALIDENVRTPHLWMGDTFESFAYADRPSFERIVEARAAQKFNHIRGLLLPPDAAPVKGFLAANQPDIAYFRELDSRIAFMNSKGIIADLILAPNIERISATFPSWTDRDRFIRYVVSRYAAYDVTWQIAGQFESEPNARAALRELGQALRKLDPYRHPRSTGTEYTSSPFSNDEWMNFVTCGTGDDQLGAIEHQLFAATFVNLRPAVEDSGAGKAGSEGTDADTFRRRLWNTWMNGQYPTFANTGTAGIAGKRIDARYADSPAAKQMTVWFNFAAGTRHWELEPYFDVDGGRAIALERMVEDENEGIEYVVYVEKPGPIEVLVQKRGYDVEWFNPVTGDRIKQKGFKGDRFTGEPPDKSHDWVLHIFRQGRLEGMLRSYKFDSRPIIMQEIEQVPQRVPYDIAEPAPGTLSLGHQPKYAAKVTKDTRATRSMMWLWTGEVASDQRGYRVIGTGEQGTFHIPSNLTSTYPANLAVRLYGMNAMGKVYSLIRVYGLTK